MFRRRFPAIACVVPGMAPCALLPHRTWAQGSNDQTRQHWKAARAVRFPFVLNAKLAPLYNSGQMRMSGSGQ